MLIVNKKVWWIALFLVGAVAIFLFARMLTKRPAPNTMNLNRPLVVGLTSWPGYAGGIVANGGFQPNEASIYFRKYGLRVKFVLVEDIDARGKAFARGGPEGLDIVWSTVDFLANESPNFVKNLIHPRAIIQVDWSRGGDAIVATDSIHTVQDLKDKKLSLVQFTPSHWFLENVLQNSGLSTEDQRKVRNNLVFSQDITSARQAFVAGEVDATVVWEPEVSQALKRRSGSHIVISTANYPNLIADIMLAKEEFIDSYPDAIEGFIRGWFDGVAEAKEHPESATRLLMQEELLFKDLGADTTRESLAWVKLADLDDNRRMFGLDGNPPLFDELFTRASQTWFERGYISNQLQAAEARDDRPLRKVYVKR